jgi:hypothetical protein
MYNYNKKLLSKSSGSQESGGEIIVTSCGVNVNYRWRELVTP